MGCHCSQYYTASASTYIYIVGDQADMKQTFLVAEVFYILILAFTKVSILMFYLRVFQRPLFRKIVMVNVGFVILIGVIFMFVVIFQCNPVNGFWDKTIESTCVDANAVAYSAAAVGIFQDFVVLFLPIPELYGLQMSTRKKCNVIGMFSIGGL
jgi:hypothetical protein